MWRGGFSDEQVCEVFSVTPVQLADVRRYVADHRDWLNAVEDHRRPARSGAEIEASIARLKMKLAARLKPAESTSVVAGTGMTRD